MPTSPTTADPLASLRMEASTELKRTSLYDEHVAAGARLVPFAGWEMPVQYEGVGPEHLAVRERAGVFDVSHMGQIETSGPEALAFLQRARLQRRRQARARRRPVLVPLRRRRRDPRRPLHLPGRRRCRVPDRLQRLQPRDRLRPLPRDRRRTSTSRSPICARERDARRPGAGGPGHRRRARRRRAAGADDTARLEVAGRRGLVCGTGYTGEDGVEILLAPPTRRRTSGASCSPPA